MFEHLNCDECINVPFKHDIDIVDFSGIYHKHRLLLRIES